MQNPKRSPNSTLPIFAATAALLLGMSGCLSNDDRTSNSDTTEAQAVSSLESRLKDSSQMKEIVEQIDRALRPVADILSDVEKYLKADEKEEIRNEVAQVKQLSITVIRQELDRLKRGLVTKKIDGRWSIDESVKWPFNRTAAKTYSTMSCDSSQLSLNGESKNGFEEVRMVLADCALPGPTTILHATVSEKMGIQAELNLGDLDQLMKSDVSKGLCAIVTGENGAVQMDCQPFVEIQGDAVFEFEHLSYQSTSLGEAMDFSLKISQVKEGVLKPIARATLHKGVGEKTKPSIDRL